MVFSITKKPIPDNTWQVHYPAELQNQKPHNKDLEELIVTIQELSRTNWQLVEHPIRSRWPFIPVKYEYRLLFPAENKSFVEDWFHEIDFYCENCINQRTNFATPETMSAYLNGMLTGYYLNK